MPCRSGCDWLGFSIDGEQASVNLFRGLTRIGRKGTAMGRKRKRRRQTHGSAWHWKQTDCWYFTMPGTRKRVPLFDEDGERIRGNEGKEAAELALARERLTWEDEGHKTPNGDGPWLVVRVCSEYIQYCERGVASGTISEGHRNNAANWLNDLCSFCGKRPAAKLKKGHIQQWIDGHETWRSPATRRGVIAIVLAAFNRAEEMHGVANPLKGLKKPPSRESRWRYFFRYAEHRTPGPFSVWRTKEGPLFPDTLEAAQHVFELTARHGRELGPQRGHA
ncbi:MAG: hypothetical protein ABIP48_03860, partial [Planctomycetota bacterium]